LTQVSFTVGLADLGWLYVDPGAVKISDAESFIDGKRSDHMNPPDARQAP